MSVSPLASGLAESCPHCGEGFLFDGFVKIAPLCDACGFDLSSVDTGEGPAVFVILIAGSLAGFGMLFMEVAVHPAVWVQLVVWLPMAAVLCLLLQRPLKGLMVASQYMNKAREGGRNDL